MLSRTVTSTVLAAAVCLAGARLGSAETAWPGYPYDSNYVEVLGSQLHYVEAGQGDPILFLHGNPTSAFLWRKIMPYLEPLGRVIAVDNIGFGKSDKPTDQAAPTYTAHVQWMTGFVRELGITDAAAFTQRPRAAPDSSHP